MYQFNQELSVELKEKLVNLILPNIEINIKNLSEFVFREPYLFAIRMTIYLRPLLENDSHIVTRGQIEEFNNSRRKTAEDAIQWIHNLVKDANKAPLEDSARVDHFMPLMKEEYSDILNVFIHLARAELRIEFMVRAFILGYENTLHLLFKYYKEHNNEEKELDAYLKRRATSRLTLFVDSFFVSSNEKIHTLALKFYIKLYGTKDNVFKLWEAEIKSQVIKYPLFDFALNIPTLTQYKMFDPSDKLIETHFTSDVIKKSFSLLIAEKPIGCLDTMKFWVKNFKNIARNVLTSIMNDPSTANDREKASGKMRQLMLIVLSEETLNQHKDYFKTVNFNDLSVLKGITLEPHVQRFIDGFKTSPSSMTTSPSTILYSLDNNNNNQSGPSTVKRWKCGSDS